MLLEVCEYLFRHVPLLSFSDINAFYHFPSPITTSFEVMSAAGRGLISIRRCL
jgi:hypothetical protein